MESNSKSYGRNTIPTYFCKFLIRKIIKIPRQQAGAKTGFELGKSVAEFKHSEVGKPLADFTV